MAPPTSPAESAAPEGRQPYRRSLPSPFLAKTYQIVDDPALDNIISWNEDGSTFIVRRPAELASEVLPKLFKHNNFMSFFRRLNSYGFSKIVPDRWEFGNELFRRGERHLLCDIRRRKVPAAAPPVTAAVVTAIPVRAPAYSADEHVLWSNSSSGVAVPRESPRLSLSAKLVEENVKFGSEENERLRSENLILENLMLEEIRLIEENERLRRENSKLMDEIGEIVCDIIMMLMSNYSAGQQMGEGVPAPELEEMSELVTPELGEVVSSPEPDLMSPELASDDVEGLVGARLFGVMIGVKRAREEVGDEMEVEVVVKSEAGSSEEAEAQARSWVL